MSTQNFSKNVKSNSDERSDNNNNDEFYAKDRIEDRKENIVETDDNLKKWVAIDGATTTCIGCDTNCAREIKNEKVTEEFCGDGGNIKINETAELLGIGGFPFGEEAKTNSVGMFHVMKLGHRVHMDSEIDNEICVEKDDKVRVQSKSN